MESLVRSSVGWVMERERAPLEKELLHQPGPQLKVVGCLEPEWSSWAEEEAVLAGRVRGFATVEVESLASGDD